ncbi:ABC transporter substrate-binding protein [Paenibacillus thalictri]|uniref:Extracellular solute-binding protein n=1 Tax=Paenibacillus thalictri TaxID=2527873 RepID=A0A4Q9DKX1_9BACL|nr:extracellular solute-binding protein [Paenibacillus thalictri]TBL72427.1 extracellular solute-binding protein [Paenibacillus thalictri]
MKKIVASATATLMLSAAVLSGCGSGDAGGKPKEGAADGAAKPKEVTLSFLSWYNADSMKDVIAAFNQKYPHIKIDLQFAPPVKDYNEKLKVLTVAGETPDLFYLSAENKFDLIKNGYALDISDQPVFKNLNKTNLEMYKYNDKLYGFAPDAWAGGILYNKKMFEKAGVQPPKTWSEFVDVMKKIKSAGMTPLIERGTFLWTLANGIFLNDVISKNPSFDQEVIDGKKKYEDGWTIPFQMWYNDVVQAGLISKDLLGVGSEQFINDFASEKVAMLVGNADHLGKIVKANPNLQVGIFPLVGTEPGTKYLYGAVNVGIAVGAKTKHKEEALTFLNFIGTQDGITPYQKMTGQMVGIPGVKYEVNPVLEQFNKMYSNNEIGLYLPQNFFGELSASVLDEMIKASQDVLAGGAKPEDVPKRMDKKRKDLSNK